MTLSVDSIVPTSANMTTYFMEVPVKTIEKSGVTMASGREPGRVTKKSGPTSNW